MFLFRPVELTTADECFVSFQSLPLIAKRCLLSTLGVLFLGIGVVGIYLPGIPTTGPVLLGIYLLAKGWPKLHQRACQSKILQPYVAYFDGRRVLTRRSRWIAALCMWTSIGVSCLLFSLQPNYQWQAITACLVGGGVGSLAIALFNPKPGQVASHDLASIDGPSTPANS